MPGFYHQPIRRREFLKASCVAGAAVVFQGCRTLPALPPLRTRSIWRCFQTRMSEAIENVPRILVDLIPGRISILPALGYNFWKDEPVGWVDARFRRAGVDLTLHAIAGNRAQDGQSTRIRWT
jgi:hypothetical protein